MNLLEPLTLGQVRAPSRVMFGPHDTNLARRRACCELRRTRPRTS
jgi:hypothetical protein